MTNTREEESAPRPRGPLWTSPIALGLLVGALVGLIEVVVLWYMPNMSVTREYFVVAAVLYGVNGAFAGLVLVVLSGFFRKAPPSRSLSLAFLLVFFGFVLAAGYVNVRRLPRATDPFSLAVTGAMLIGFILLGYGLFRFFRAIAGTGAGERLARSRPALWGWILGIVLAVIVGVLSYVPSGGERWSGEGSKARPGVSVLFVVIDALRADHLSAYGYGRETSPSIDRWAREGVLFETARAQAPWTKPSTATMLTGYYPSVLGVNELASGIPESIHPLPEIMKENGYRTGIFTADAFVSPLFGFQRGVDRFYVRMRPRFAQLMLGHIYFFMRRQNDVFLFLVRRMKAVERALVGGGGDSSESFSAEGLSQAFMDWLDEDPEKPFFAYVHYMEAHAPYAPPPPYDKTFMPPPLAGMARVSQYPRYTGFLPFDKGPAISADSLSNMIALYDGGIRFADLWVGRVIEDLKQRGVFDNTLILLTADHGEEFNEHGGWGHGHSLYDELLHVPLVLSCPKAGVTGGRRIPHVVRHIDLVPTILDICGIAPPEGLDGTSMIPIILEEEPVDPPRMVMSEVYYGGHFARSLIDGNEKVIFSQKGRTTNLAFYDLESDPGELEDLADLEPRRAEELAARLEEFHDIAAGKSAAGYTVTIDEDTKERLKALGYIQ
jgi:arylsulfatase A-like enzyme